MELFSHSLKVPVLCYSGLAGANDNHYCLVCLSSGWVKLQGRGTDTIRPESMCSCVGGSILRRTLRLEWARSEELSRHTVLPPERAEAETERSVYRQTEQAPTEPVNVLV